MEQTDKTGYTVTLQAQGWVFAAEAQQSLLLSAEKAGVVLPSSCRNGTCRTCICKMDAGEVRYRIEWPGLSAEEKREGWILPCVAYALSDLVLQVPAAALQTPP